MNRWIAQLPNAVTCVRFLVLPALLRHLWKADFRVAEGLLLLAVLSDALDGWLARRLNVASASGAWLDASADKCLLWTVFLLLGVKGWLPFWFLAAVFGRDVLLLGAAVQFMIRRQGLFPELQASRMGKWAIAVQMLLLILLFCIIPLRLSVALQSLVSAVLLLSVLPGYWSVWKYAQAWKATRNAFSG